MAAKDSGAGTADREIAATRIYDASRELVWRAWTEPKHIAQWWGPNGFTSTIETMEVRVGGIWRFTMHGPDGKDYPNEIVYTEVVKPSLLAYDHAAPKFHVTVTFVEAGAGKTKLAMRMVFPTKAERDAIAEKHRAVEGLNQTLAHLAEHLGRMA